MKSRILFLVILISITAGCRTKQPEVPVKPGDYKEAFERLDRFILEKMKSHGAAGLNITIVNKEGIIWQKDYGYSNIERETPVSSDTIFLISSLTKVFTGTAIMQLIEKGLISLDDDILQYIPELDLKRIYPTEKSITVKNLLTHYSGLPSDLNIGEASISNPDYKTAFMNLPEILNKEFLVFMPEELFQYSNANYILLGIIISRVSGISFENYIEKFIFEPLGMKHSNIDYKKTDRKHLTNVYDEDGNKREMVLNLDLPAGSLYTSGNDMSLFMQMMLGGGRGIIQESTLEQMYAKQNDNLPMASGFDMGLSYWIGENPHTESPVLYHYGDNDYSHSLLYSIPEEDIAISIFMNSDAGKNLRIPIAKEAVSLLFQARNGVSPSPDIPFKPVELSAEEVKAFEGVYAGFPGHCIIRDEGNNLSIEIFGSKIHLLYDGENTFYPEFRILGIPIRLSFLEGVSFKKVKYNNELYLGPYIDDAFLGFLEKVEPVDIPELWLARTGRYKNEKSAEYTIRFNKKIGFLTVCYSWGGFELESILIPISDSQAITAGHAQNCGLVLTFTDENRASFRGDYNLVRD